MIATPESRASGPVAVRRATMADLDASCSLLREAELPLTGVDEQFGEGYAVAESGGAIVGVEGIEVYGTDGLLRSAAVSPSWRGRGVGDELTRDRIEWARRRGLTALYLLTTTAGDYFPRFGFTTTQRDAAPAGIRASREFSEACPSTALFMRLSLSPEIET